MRNPSSIRSAGIEVAFTIFVDPGRRVYVRRINVTGNTKTRDVVVRREMRQAEGGWYDVDAIKLSKERLERLVVLQGSQRRDAAGLGHQRTRSTSTWP